MLHFLLIWNDNDSLGIYPQIGRLCNFRKNMEKNTIIYIPKSVWDGYGVEFIPINIHNFPVRLIDYAKMKYGYEPKRFIIVKDKKTLGRLLPILHDKGKAGCVVGILESLLKYVYASKKRTKLNNSSKAGREVRNSAKKELIRLQGDLLTECSILSMFDDTPVTVLWLGYDFTYVNEGERTKREKIYLYKLIKELGNVVYNTKIVR